MSGGPALLTDGPALVTAGVISRTWGTLPTTPETGTLCLCTDYGTTGNLLIYKGGRWVPVNGQALVSSVQAVSANVGATPTIVHQYQFPAGMLQIGDKIRARFAISKSGNTDTGPLRIYMGTAGTTSDTQISAAVNLLSSANRAAGVDVDFCVISATTIRQLGAIATPTGYSVTGNTAQPSDVTIANISNALYFSIGIFSGGSTDTVALQNAQLFVTSSTS